MKIKSEEEFLDKIDADFAWRRRELSSIYSSIQLSSNVNVRSFIRIGITMLYAHWEGFVKNSADLYLNYVATRKLKHKELKPCFVALSLRKQLIDYQDAYKAISHIKLIEYLMKGMEERATIPYNNIVKTNDNLNFDVLSEILCLIGIDYTQYDIYKFTINKRLVEQRNHIAHGQYLEIDRVIFNQIYEEIMTIMEDIKEKLTNCVHNKEYAC